MREGFRYSAKYVLFWCVHSYHLLLGLFYQSGILSNGFYQKISLSQRSKMTLTTVLWLDIASPFEGVCESLQPFWRSLAGKADVTFECWFLLSAGFSCRVWTAAWSSWKSWGCGGGELPGNCWPRRLVRIHKSKDRLRPPKRTLWGIRGGRGRGLFDIVSRRCCVWAPSCRFWFHPSARPGGAMFWLTAMLVSVRILFSFKYCLYSRCVLVQ